MYDTPRGRRVSRNEPKLTKNKCTTMYDTLYDTQLFIKCVFHTLQQMYDTCTTLVVSTKS